MNYWNGIFILSCLAWPSMTNCAIDESQFLPVYTIVGSNSIKQGSIFKFSMLSKHLKEPLQANFSLSGTDMKGKFQSLTHTNAIISENDVKTFQFDTAQLSFGQYTFRAQIYDPWYSHFAVDTWHLEFMPQVFQILIQTDKQLYQAEDLIRFRLFALDADTRPVNVLGSTVVKIINRQGFIMTQFDNVTFVKGRFAGDFQLGIIVPTGTWIIRVQVDKEIFEKTIEVEPYELPLFTASIDVPEFVAISDGSFPVKINVDYTFGKKVFGTAIVKFIRYGTLEILKKTVSIGNASENFDVSIRSDLGVRRDETVDIKLEFTDSMSNKKINATASTRLRKISTVLYVIASPTFKRRSTYKFAIKARGFDGLPKENVDVTVKILSQSRCLQGRDEICSEELLTRLYASDNKGDIDGDIPTVAGHDFITIVASCVSCDALTHSAEFYEPVFDIDVLTNKPTVGEKVLVEVSSTKIVTSAFCYFLAKNVHLDLIAISFQNGVAKFEFIPDGTFTPTTQITCAGIDYFGERFEAHTTVNFEELPNKMKIEVLTPTVKPGMNATIKVTSAINSTVFLMAIDQRLLNLQKSRSLGDPWTSLRNQLMEFMRLQTQNSRSFEMLRVSNPSIAKTNRLVKTSSLIPTIIQASSVSRQSRGRTVAPISSSKVRRNFQETLLWIELDITNPLETDSSQGTEIVNFPTPDSITSYDISGMTFSPSVGTGIVGTPPSVMGLQKFFMIMSLPYSMKQSEILHQRVVIFNDVDEKATIYLTINNTADEYDIQNDDGCWFPVQGGKWYEWEFTPEKKVSSFLLKIKPKTTGIITIKIRADLSCNQADCDFDEIEGSLRVIPSGFERVITTSMLLLKQGSSIATQKLECAIPSHVDESTVSTKITIVGDLLGDIKANLAAFLIEPTGCAEQILAKFAPAAIIHDYLKSTGQLTDDIKEKVVNYTRIGLLNVITLRRSNGGYSFFPYQTGSTWLTAFTVKILHKVQAYTTVDPVLIRTALDFILSQKNTDGSFKEDQTTSHYTYYGGHKSKVALTSYISILFSQLLADYPDLQTSRDEALEYSLQKSNDGNAYELAITCYALHLASHNSFTAKYNKLLKLATLTKEYFYWDIYSHTSLNVETTAYALMFMHKIDIDRSVKMARYIMSKKNMYGAYQSSQDTVVAVESLAAAANLITNFNGLMLINAMPDHEGSPIRTYINDTNEMELQKFDFKQNTRSVIFTADGPSSGKAIISFTCIYFEDAANIEPRFHVTHKLINQCATPLKSSICINYISNGADIRSNMVIMKLRMPSGYVYDPVTPQPSVIKLLEAEDENTRIVAYFDSMTQVPICFGINAIQTSIVDKLQGFAIEVKDYYSPDKKSDSYVTIPELESCK